MKATNTIDPEVLFEYLERNPFFLSLSRSDKKLWTATIKHWEENCAGQDERKLAYVLGEVHHLAKSTFDQSPGFSKDLLAEYFAVTDTEWQDVKEVMGGLKGPSSSSQLADIIYTTLIKTRPLSLSWVLRDE